MTVVLRVNRFAPRPARDRERSRKSSPFARKSSPFADARAARKPRGRSWVQEYEVQARGNDTLLDCLLAIKRDIDPTLAFRYSCGHGMCGSDAVAVNGTPMLLCKAKVRDCAHQPVAPIVDDAGFRRTSVDGEPSPVAETAKPVVELAPLPGFPVQRDLVADIDPMLEQIRRFKPYLQADGVLATTVDGKVDVFEYLQRPEQLARYERLSTCITCGVCEGACPVYAGGEAFIGPAALINQARFIDDSRDRARQERLEALDTADGFQACQSVRACSRECPVGIDVGEEIWQLIAQSKEQEA
ncbi:succinate dehydrogenase iron-sulfur protein [Bifidobacterium cuniculi]|uniref:succinate dehydrogenase n=2 Tax=Bifidobacterium cuniculi TaxID=1688 RepID=A0A087B3U3_9BIFI|nr:succinate dehydrogenase iron-sulfur protein [Bifidobacterium cuniculi]